MADTIKIPHVNTVCVTGHRPKSMGWGYDMYAPCWQEVLRQCKSILLASGCTDAWTGMALGVDQIFAQAVLALQNDGYVIKLHCAIPFEGQESKWTPASISDYRAILSRASEVVTVNPGGFTGWKMTARDHFMVDRSDLVIAVWNGQNTGTGRCVQYAKDRNKAIYRIDPAVITEQFGTR